MLRYKYAYLHAVTQTLKFDSFAEFVQREESEEDYTNTCTTYIKRDQTYFPKSTQQG